MHAHGPAAPEVRRVAAVARPASSEQPCAGAPGAAAPGEGSPDAGAPGEGSPGEGGRAPRWRALVVSGSIGLGHAMVTEACHEALEGLGWSVRSVDAMALLGSRSGRAGERAFKILTRFHTVYDGLHFAHLRTGSRLARALDRVPARRLVPVLEAELASQPADLVLAAFATGASAAASLKRRRPCLRTAVLCTDVSVHSMWAHEDIDLFLVTSPAAAASVRRFVPRARVCVVPAPVRSAILAAPSRDEARAELEMACDQPCVLLMGGGWGLGPLARAAAELARSGITVLAVAGRNAALERRLRTVAAAMPRVRAFGFTDRIPQLMAAADIVITTPGATTCSEARALGRPLLLLDAVPGHGRDNLQHELEQGHAEVAGPDPAKLAAHVLAMLEDRSPAPVPVADRWEDGLQRALALLGLSAEAREAERSP